MEKSIGEKVSFCFSIIFWSLGVGLFYFSFNYQVEKEVILINFLGPFKNSLFFFLFSFGPIFFLLLKKKEEFFKNYYLTISILSGVSLFIFAQVFNILKGLALFSDIGKNIFFSILSSLSFIHFPIILGLGVWGGHLYFKIHQKYNKPIFLLIMASTLILLEKLWVSFNIQEWASLLIPLFLILSEAINSSINSKIVFKKSFFILGALLLSTLSFKELRTTGKGSNFLLKQEFLPQALSKQGNWLLLGNSPEFPFEEKKKMPLKSSFQGNFFDGKYDGVIIFQEEWENSISTMGDPHPHFYFSEDFFSRIRGKLNSQASLLVQVNIPLSIKDKVLTSLTSMIQEAFPAYQKFVVWESLKTPKGPLGPYKVIWIQRQLPSPRVSFNKSYFTAFFPSSTHRVKGLQLPTLPPQLKSIFIQSVFVFISLALLITFRGGRVKNFYWRFSFLISGFSIFGVSLFLQELKKVDPNISQWGEFIFFISLLLGAFLPQSSFKFLALISFFFSWIYSFRAFWPIKFESLNISIQMGVLLLFAVALGNLLGGLIGKIEMKLPSVKKPQVLSILSLGMGLSPLLYWSFLSLGKVWLFPFFVGALLYFSVRPLIPKKR